MRYLFYFVHPAKYHLSRATINKLKAEGHDVDVIIVGRDILEDLVKNECWNYKKIFPNGRKLKGIPSLFTASFLFFPTIYKLLWITRNKKYNVAITDDLYTFVGRIRRIPTIFFTDDDLSAVPESRILMISANHIFAPQICDLGRYNKKKLGYFGYKSLAHLHPNHFSPDPKKVFPIIGENKRFFFLRTVSATSTHDFGKKGLSDDFLRLLIKELEQSGKVILNSERSLPDDLKKYILPFNKNDVAHFLSFATLFISDSTTMCAEAAVLGTPAIEFDDWYSDFKQYYELNGKYNLLFGFSTDQADDAIEKIKELIALPDLKEEFQKRRLKMLNDKIDVSQFLLWIITGYPENAKQYLKDHSIQNMFK